MELSTELRYLKGVGEQRAKKLEKLGLRTVEDLLTNLPRDYADRREQTQIACAAEGETVCIEAMVAKEPTFSHIRQGLDVVKVQAVDETGTLELTFFNQSYQRNNLRRGNIYVFCGKVESSGRCKTMNTPLVEPAGSHRLTGRIVPVYSLTAGIGEAFLVKLLEQVQDCMSQLPEQLPDEIRKRYRLCHVEYAYRQLHAPDSMETLAIARRRLAFEELFLLSLGMQRLRGRRDEMHCPPYKQLELAPFLQGLPFTPTAAQLRVMEDIKRDFGAGRPMNRLVQGDVGSGKTIIGAAALYCAVKNGQQAALMAPTELLAVQHYRSLSPLLSQYGIRCGLLTGGKGSRERKETLQRLAQGELDVAIGTHALISECVAFHKLGMVVADEQHRFGVRQRAALAAKGNHPHLLVMSATPIPRTLALLLYGDLDVSVIDQLPAGRRQIRTYAVDGSYRQRVYRFVEREVAAGRQAYVVCTLVETAEGEAAERKAATAYARQLQKALPSCTVGCVHGRMKPKEKDAVMEAFSSGELSVLVSTTVVEVGVDVPNATLMVIEDADRFGLSQLHQLRGRVGRGQYQSYCIMISDAPGEEAKRRLQVLSRTTDGFQIAEEDLRLRGPGDFFGQRQHGLPRLRMADVSCDVALLSEVRQAAAELLAQDSELKAYPQIRQNLQRLFAENGSGLN